MMTNRESIENKTIPIFSMKLAGLAMCEGFVIQALGKDEDGSGRTVFYFNNTPALLGFIERYRNRNKKHKAYR